MMHVAVVVVVVVVMVVVVGVVFESGECQYRCDRTELVSLHH